MQLLHLQYFCAVAKSQNITKTAAELWISQPALSRAIRSLENELGCELFDRVGKNIILNDTGRLFYERVSGSISQLDEAIKMVRVRAAERPGEIRVRMRAAECTAHELKNGFHQLYPEINLKIVSSFTGDVDDISDCDFLIYATPDRHKELENIDLLEERLMLVMNSNHPLAKESSISLEQAVKYPFQILKEGENLRSNLLYICRQQGFIPQISLTAADTYAWLDLYDNPQALVIIPEFTMRNLPSRDVIIRPLEDDICKRSIFLAYLPHIGENQRAFAKYCKDFFANYS